MYWIREKDSIFFYSLRMLKQDVRKRFDETAGSKESSYPYKMPQDLGKSLRKQTVNAMLQNDRRRHAPIVTCTLEYREKVSPVKMQPFPPSTSSRTKTAIQGTRFENESSKVNIMGLHYAVKGTVLVNVENTPKNVQTRRRSLLTIL